MCVVDCVCLIVFQMNHRFQILQNCCVVWLCLLTGIQKDIKTLKRSSVPVTMNCRAARACPPTSHPCHKLVRNWVHAEWYETDIFLNIHQNQALAHLIWVPQHFLETCLRSNSTVKNHRSPATAGRYPSHWSRPPTCSPAAPWRPVLFPPLEPSYLPGGVGSRWRRKWVENNNNNKYK